MAHVKNTTSSSHYRNAVSNGCGLALLVAGTTRNQAGRQSWNSDVEQCLAHGMPLGKNSSGLGMLCTAHVQKGVGVKGQQDRHPRFQAAAMIDVPG